MKQDEPFNRDATAVKYPAYDPRTRPGWLTRLGFGRRERLAEKDDFKSPPAVRVEKTPSGPVLERLHGDWEREQIVRDASANPPWKALCHLESTWSNGSVSCGSGFFVGNGAPRVVLGRRS